MADSVAEATAKLQLDEETGELVSKNELKKRLQKRARKAARAQAPAATAKPPAKESENPKADVPHYDEDSMFKQGFLAEVYKENPTKTVLTRFPPEPNGYLHLGHAKAIAVNFGFARHHGGKTILRFDDTNPDAEKDEYFVAIEEAIRWLGFQPSTITYSSDNFDKLYELAEKLIQLGKAYVCHCQKHEIQLQRGGEKGKEGPRYRCGHADQDVETNLNKFRDMRDGKYEPRTAFLRMKQDIESGNPQMWDFSAYRIPENQTPHYRTKDQWKIYPTYDFAHCLCDSFEGITHSLCTTEFMLSRESYEWLNRTLGVYEPMQREYGRLNITGTIMSKRGLTQLVHNKIVKDWDDPRLFTLLGLRRRGVPPDAILSFVQELGVTTAGSVISTTRLDQSIRRYLEVLVPRLMLVLDPVAVVIEDIGELEGQMLDIPFHPKEPMMGNHQVKLTKTIYVDRSDFQETDDPKFFRLAPGKTVGLYKVPFPVKVTGFSKDFTTNLVNEVRVVFCKDGVKPRTYIQWVPESSQAIEVRIYHPLFRSDNPNAVEGGFMKDVNFDSETVFASALVESGFEQVRQRAPWPESAGEGSGHTVGPESVRFQAMRVAYFAMDSDSTSDRVVLNRIVSLKEDPNK